MAPRISKLAGGGVFKLFTSMMWSFFNFLTSYTAWSKILLASATESSASFLIALALLASAVAIISSSATIFWVSSAYFLSISTYFMTFSVSIAAYSNSGYISFKVTCIFDTSTFASISLSKPVCSLIIDPFNSVLFYSITCLNIISNSK